MKACGLVVGMVLIGATALASISESLFPRLIFTNQRPVTVEEWEGVCRGSPQGLSCREETYRACDELGGDLSWKEEKGLVTLWCTKRVPTQSA